MRVLAKRPWEEQTTSKRLVRDRKGKWATRRILATKFVKRVSKRAARREGRREETAKK